MHRERTILVRETAAPGAVSLARIRVTELLDAERPGLATEAREGIRLAVTECCANAVRHAYAPGHPGEIEVTAAVADGELTVTVRDHGRGMGDASPRAGLGLGLPIVRTAADLVEFAVPDDGGAEVRMHFRLAGSG